MADNKALSLGERASLVRHAISNVIRDANRYGTYFDGYTEEVYDDYAIVCDYDAGQFWRVDYSIGEQQAVTIAPRDSWVRVEKEFVPMKTLIAFGSEVKALGDGRFGGYAVVFGAEKKTDLEGEFFTSDTDFDIEWDDANKATTYWQHGKDPVLKKRKLTRVELTKTDAGIWAEGIMQERDDYEKFIAQWIGEKKLGFSTGTAGHLMERETVGKAIHIKRWPIVEVSLTHTPAEFRTQVLPLETVESKFVPLKSLMDSQQANKPEVQPEASSGADARQSAKAADVQVLDNEEKNMPENTTPPENVTREEFKALSENVNKVLKYLEDSPAMKSAGYYTETGGTSDKNVKNVADMLMAIKRGDVARCTKHYGLVPYVKAQTEDSGPTGGYYVPQGRINDLLPGISLTSGLGNLVRRIPVREPAGTAPIRDYSRTPTSAAGNSAAAMGMESQGRTENGAYTEETIYFEQLTWHVWDYASGYVKLSRELRNDASMIEALIKEAIEEDVANKEEFSILRGNGVGKPLGVLNWAGRIEIDEDTDNTFAIADADEIVSRLLMQNNSRIAWVHHPGATPNINGFARGTSDSALHSNLAGAMSTYLHGYPRFVSQHLPAQGTDGYVILGDWSRYVLFEMGGLYIDFSEHADFMNGNDVWRFGKRQDGQPAMTAAVTLADGTFTLSPFVILANKT